MKTFAMRHGFRTPTIPSSEYNSLGRHDSWLAWVMTRYSGFYDLPTAWSNVFWGILLGGLYSSQVYNIIIVKDIERQLVSGDSAGFPIVDLILLCLITSILAHFILRRNRVRSGSSQTTSGWALGLAIGGMFGMVTIFAVLRLLSGFNLIITVSMLSIMAPRCEAIISSYQGQLMLMGRKWGAILRDYVEMRICCNVCISNNRTNTMGIHCTCCINCQ